MSRVNYAPGGGQEKVFVLFCFFKLPSPAFSAMVKLLRAGSGINDSREPEALSPLLSKKCKGALRKDSVHIVLQ